MSHKVRLDTNALRDIDQQMAYFAVTEDLRHRIGDFEDDLLQRLDRIGSNPYLRREVYPDVRREALRVFRYHVWYRTYAGADFVDVFAILHQVADRQAVVSRLR
ncbi:MAG: hypothetical protein FWH11_07615 [Micrococcales bacterium]|nr:hypothetical protein [Micrococcales bacterium]